MVLVLLAYHVVYASLLEGVLVASQLKGVKGRDFARYRVGEPGNHQRVWIFRRRCPALLSLSFKEGSIQPPPERDSEEVFRERRWQLD